MKLIILFIVLSILLLFLVNKREHFGGGWTSSSSYNYYGYYNDYYNDYYNGYYNGYYNYDYTELPCPTDQCSKDDYGNCMSNDIDNPVNCDENGPCGTYININDEETDCFRKTWQDCHGRYDPHYGKCIKYDNYWNEVLCSDVGFNEYEDWDRYCLDEEPSTQPNNSNQFVQSDCPDGCVKIQNDNGEPSPICYDESVIETGNFNICIEDDDLNVQPGSGQGLANLNIPTTQNVVITNQPTTTTTTTTPQPTTTSIPPQPTTTSIPPQPTTSTTTIVPKCSFIPWGPDKEACINRCRNPEDRHLWGGEDCSLDKCNEICNNCNTKRCMWVQQYIDTDDRCNTFTSKDACNFQDGCKYDPFQQKCKSIPKKSERITPDHPPKQLISVIPVNNSLTVVWKSKDKELPNTGFLIRYFKTFKTFEGLKLKYIEKNETDKYTIELEDIDNEEYSVSVSAINEKGIGEASNIVRMTPQKF